MLDIQAIRERHENAKRGYLESSVIESHEDVPALLDEIERLRGALEYISSFEKVTLLACDINVNELGEVARQALAGVSA